MQTEPTPKFLNVTQWAAATFEERGTMAPFTTPLLSGARVRPEKRHGLVLLAQGFAETRSVYVVPWPSLPTVVTLSVHDRALHKAILSANAIDPIAMRRQALNIAAMGLAGPEVQASAQKAMEEERKYADEIHCVLILFLLRDLDLDVSNIKGMRLDQSGTLGRIKTELNAAIEPLGIEAATLYERIGTLAEKLVPLGPATYGRQGRLRRLLADLIDFQNGMTARCDGLGFESEEYYRFASEVAAHTVGIADSIIQSLDTQLADLPGLLRGWKDRYPEIERLAARVSWLLDGWDYVLGFARGIDDWRREEVTANLENLSLMLPIVPRNEGAENEDNERRFDELTQRRRVNALEDWRSGRIDLELKRRLETAMARALEPPPAKLAPPDLLEPAPEVEADAEIGEADDVLV